MFNKKRGLALGIMSTGVGVGGFIFSILLGSLLIPSNGWQGGYYGIAAAHLLIIPLAMFIRGKKKPAVAPQEQTAKGTGIVTNEIVNMLRSPSLWVISANLFYVSFQPGWYSPDPGTSSSGYRIPGFNGVFYLGISGADKCIC